MLILQSWDATWARKHRSEHYAIMAELDKDGNGKLDRDEVDAMLRSVFKLKLSLDAKVEHRTLQGAMQD